MATEKRLFDDNMKFINEDFNNVLISRDLALRAITPENATSLPDDQLVILLTARKKLKSVPTVDAVKVLHGQWHPNNNCGYRCSICDFWVAFRSLNNYCPNCGAKMDGDWNG